MSKNVQRIILLIAMGIGFGLYALYQITSGPDPDHVVLGLFYLVPSIAAFVAVIILPSRPAS